MSAERLKARVRTLRYEATRIVSVELVPTGNTTFPSFTAGAHIDLHLPNGIVRSYSLVNAQTEVDRYVIAVLDEPDSRGGSRYIHELLRCGAQIEIGSPRNQFPIDESATSSVLIAGGIGITAILCMARRLRALRRDVRVAYAARSRVDAAFVDDLKLLGIEVELHFSDEHHGRRFDMDAWLATQPDGTHAYCCGPKSMIDAFELACERASIRDVHLERFHPVEGAVAASTETYVVELARSGRTIEVAPGASLLDTLLKEGVDIDYSCREGICGACEVRVVAGQPVHRDSILNAAQREANEVMYMCVSHGTCSSRRNERLVLDL